MTSYSSSGFLFTLAPKIPKAGECEYVNAHSTAAKSVSSDIFCVLLNIGQELAVFTGHRGQVPFNQQVSLLELQDP